MEDLLIPFLCIVLIYYQRDRIAITPVRDFTKVLWIIFGLFSIHYRKENLALLLPLIFLLNQREIIY